MENRKPGFGKAGLLFYEGVWGVVAIAFLVALLFLSAGFAKLMAMAINWICAQRLPKKFVVADKCVNLLAITLYPLVILWGLGNRYLSGARSTAELEFYWSLLIIPGAVGFVFLARSTMTWWLYRPPACEVSVMSETFDTRSGIPDWRESFIGPGLSLGTIARLPGNQQFLVNRSTKTYQLPGLPADWDGLSIVQLSDFHFHGGVTRPYFEAVCELASQLQPDMYVFSGDLLDRQERLDWLADTLGRLQAPLGNYFVLGNHDWYLDPDAMRREFERLGWTNLAGRTVSVRNPLHPSSPPVVLCGDETPWMGSHPDVTGSPAEGFRILVSHTPDNIEWARRQQIHLMLAGHTHGGQIRLPILGPVYSPSAYDCRYASGVFWLDPTLLYVSRGVSGKEPIRYGCPPEVTRLVLRSGMV